MARNPGSEAEAAKTLSPAGSDALSDPVLGGGEKNKITQNTPAAPATPPPLIADSPARLKTTQASSPPSAATPSTGGSPLKRTGGSSLKISGSLQAMVSDPSVIGPGSLGTPTPLSTRGLHAPAVTPGPVVQPFVTLGRYQLLSRLAVGGMAEVYLARQGELSGFKTLVVVKKVLPHLAVKPDFIAMFFDEARIASLLDHPNIVRITEVGRAGDEYFLAMELVQGKPLASILQQSEKAKTPIPHNLAALVVANAAAGLHHAHQLADASGNPLGLVHRDVSPQNIMVSFEGSVKVIDFGIARALGRLGDTVSGSLKGKLGYMAPEQARGEQVDARADLFSLGVVLWECVAGRRLFLRENELATLRAVAYEPIPSVSKLVEVDPILDAIVRRSVARNIDERFQDAEEMRIALERWVFSSGGASTHDLASLMKAWFPAEHVQWQRAARLALDMQESDPPIEVAFPNLSTGKTGHSRTGAGSGSGPRLPGDSGNRASRPPSVSIPLPAASAPPAKARLRFAVPVAIALSLLGLVVLIVGLSSRKAAVAPEPKPAAAVRPMVEILPTVAGAPVNPTDHEPSLAPKLAAQPQDPGTVSPQRERETTLSIQKPTTGSTKKPTSAGGKRAILRSHTRSKTATRSTVNGKKPRPNPF
jgi:serine/threonine protein kinase